jgi:hypothetical protein
MFARSGWGHLAIDKVTKLANTAQIFGKILDILWQPDVMVLNLPEMYAS